MRSARLVALFIGLALLANAARAHHSQAGIFNSTKTIEVTGVIQSVSWRNPHGQILLSVRDQAGKETVWDAETASISILRNRGADGSSIRVGDRVTIAGSPSVRNRPEILARSVLLPSGYEFTFGSPNALLPSRQGGPHHRPRQDRGRRRRGDGSSRRPLPRVVHEHERPSRLPHVQGRVSADSRRPDRTRQMEPAG